MLSNVQYDTAISSKNCYVLINRLKSRRILLKSIIYYRPSSESVRSQTHLFHFSTLCFYKIHYTCSVSSRSMYSKRFISIRISTKYLCAFLAFIILATCSVHLTFFIEIPDRDVCLVNNKNYEARL